MAAAPSESTAAALDGGEGSDEEPQLHNESWRQYLDDSGAEDSGQSGEPSPVRRAAAEEDSGEDSDTVDGGSPDVARHKQDMEVLMKAHQKQQQQIMGKLAEQQHKEQQLQQQQQELEQREQQQLELLEQQQRQLKEQEHQQRKKEEKLAELERQLHQKEEAQREQESLLKQQQEEREKLETQERKEPAEPSEAGGGSVAAQRTDDDEEEGDETEQQEFQQQRWVVMPNKDCIQSKSGAKIKVAHQCPSGDLEACKRVCIEKGFGAFVVSKGYASFVKEPAESCRQRASQATAAILYLCYERPESAAAAISAAPGSPGKKKSGLMSRMFGTPGSKAVEAVLGTSMLGENIDDKDEAWYNQQLSRLGREGTACTKVGTNGKPYDRRIHIDTRNLTVEIRGGRTGSTGILLDDLVDLRTGFASPEFEQFNARIKKGSPSGSVAEITEQALVLQTPHRTFSLLFGTSQARTIVGHCIIYLLRSRNRGVMTSGVGSNATAQSKESKVLKNGDGTVTYKNNSTYTGQFQNSMRHGQGTLLLTDGTKYESEWRNDERHGKGKENCPDGTTFVGTYAKGMRHGVGEMTWPEGSKYSGQFERGRANGEGELLRTDGSVYRGQFSEDCMSGEGRMRWRDGVEYVGQFITNRREGFGKMHWTSGKWKSYEGIWKDGMQHDRGTLSDHNGGEFRGVFKAGKLIKWEDEP